MNILEVNILILLLLGFILQFLIKNKISKTLFIVFITIQFIVLCGLRHESIGNDTLRYKKRFLNLVDSNNMNVFLNDSEWGYTLIQKIFLFFSDNFQVYLFITSLVIFIPLSIFIYRYSKNIFLSFLLYICLGFFDFAFTGIRQSMALVLILLSYKYIVKRDFLKFFIINIIAILFHNTAIIFFPMYFLSMIRWKVYHIFLLIATYVIFYVFRLPIGKYLSLLYRDEIFLSNYDSSGSIGGLTIFILMVLIFGLVVYNPLTIDDLQNKALANIIVFSLFIQSLSSFSYMFTRLNMYYLIFMILYIPYIIKNIDKLRIGANRKEKYFLKSLINIIIIVVFIIYYIKGIDNNRAGILPYYFWWE